MSKKNADRSRAERAAEAVRAQQAGERRRRFIAIGSVVAVIALLIGGGFVLQNMRDTTGDAPATAPSIAAAPDGDGTPSDLKGYGIFIGEPDAPKTVTIYEDLQCPACANFEAAVGDGLKEKVDAGDLRVEYRMISFLDGQSSNEYSSRALNAALVVLDTAGLDAFRAFHDDLYANQPPEGGPGPEDEQLITRAVAAGADEDTIRKPIEDKVFAQWIKNATDQMSKDGYTSTPTVLIDGKEAKQEDVLALVQ